MNKENNPVDWSSTTWEGSRREQLRRWADLSLDEILEAQEEMAELAEMFRLEASEAATAVSR